MLPPTMNLAALMGGMAPEPEPLPSLPMGVAMPMPMAPQGQMAPPMPTGPDPRAVNLSSHHSAAELVRDLAPLLLSVIAGAKNPRHGAALARGQAAGLMAARREQMADEGRAFDQQRLQSTFMMQVANDLKGIKDPQQVAQYLSLVDEVGAKQFGMVPGWSSKIPVQKTSQTDALKGDIEKKLAAFDKDPRWKTVAGTPQEAKISFQLSNGQSMSVAAARRLVNQQFLDEQGQAAYAPIVVPKVKPAYQSKDMLLDGKPSAVGFNPATNRYFVGDEDVTARVKPIPRAARGNGRSGGGGDDSALVDRIIENPTIYDSLTPTKKTALAGALAAKGFGFGKPLAESAIGKMAETKSAIASLRDLRTTLQENEQYIGPVAGLQALNPYSAARGAQAKIDLVKQRVGKALEGGVLRKEDEEKYKRILATLRDTPATAITKVDQLIESLERDLKAFENEQRGAGRRVSGGAPAKTDAPSKAAFRFNPATRKLEPITR